MVWPKNKKANMLNNSRENNEIKSKDDPQTIRNDQNENVTIPVPKPNGMTNQIDDQMLSRRT